MKNNKESNIASDIEEKVVAVNRVAKLSKVAVDSALVP